MPIRSDGSWNTLSFSGASPCWEALAGVMTVKSAGLMRYAPAFKVASCRPFSPPPWMNARASWKSVQATSRPSIRSEGTGLPSAATTRPISPGRMTIRGILWTRYAHRHRPKYHPGDSSRAWYPASPSSATRRPGGRARPKRFTTRPEAFSGITQVPSSTTNMPAPTSSPLTTQSRCRSNQAKSSMT